MSLKKPPHWTDLYYKVVERYFWRPQDIGRKSGPDRQRRPWEFWKEKLSSQEPQLNHMLDLFFHMIPPALLDASVSALAGRNLYGFELVEPTPGTIDDNLVQPGIILKNNWELVFIEMKVDSRSSVDQFVVYGIAALILIREYPSISSLNVIVLSRHDDH